MHNTSKIDLTNSHAVMSTMLKGNTFDSGLIGKSITILSNATEKTDARAHATAMAIMYRSLPQELGGHRDCSAAIRLIGALGKGGKAAAMIAWFHTHTNIRIKTPKGTPMTAGMLSEKQPKMYRELTSEDIEAARQYPYWVAVSVEGAEKFLTDARFIARLAKLMADYEKEGSDLDNHDNVVLMSSIMKRVEAAKLVAAKVAQEKALAA